MSHSTAPAQPRVVVAMLTYRRPEVLRDVVPALLEQAAACSVPARVVLVDNDPDAGARATVQEWVGDLLSYVHEPRPGIAAARNRALDAASDADAVIFIDDDEVPSPGWLDALVAGWQAWGCAGVVGPVVSLFDGAADPWIEASALFERPRRQTGAAMRGAATNNLLLDLNALRATGLRFDDAFGLTGGSDTMLTHDLVAHGQVIRWCDEAEVTTVVQVERTSREYVLRRTFRTGTTWSRVKLSLAADRRRCRADLIARGCVRLARGGARLAQGTLTRSVTHQAQGACAVASAGGMLLGALGYRYAEYARPASLGSAAECCFW